MCGLSSCSQCQPNTITSTSTGALGNMLGQYSGLQNAYGTFGNANTMVSSKLKQKAFYGWLIDPMRPEEKFRITMINSYNSTINAMTTENLTIQGNMFTTQPNKEYPLKFEDWEGKVILLQLYNVEITQEDHQNLSVIEIDNLQYLELVTTWKENSLLGGSSD